jgi:D-glycero-D-manno-heptose 1,7-bisphosphate phosphatase
VLKVDLHIHTADDPFDLIPYTPSQLIDQAAELRVGALAITLHDCQLDVRPLEAYARNRGVLLIPGVERTIKGRHVLLVNFPRSAAAVGDFSELAALKRRYPRGLIIAPHPFFPLTNCLRGWTTRYADLFDAVEVNGFHTRTVDFNRAAITWARLQGKPLVGNSDAHQLPLLGMTFSMVEAEPDPDAICDAVRAGRVEVHAEPLSAMDAGKYFASVFRNRRPTPPRDASTIPAEAPLSQAVVLDRDGVVNPDVGYPHRADDAVLFPDVAPALLRLQAAGYRLAVVSNQSGIARGYYTLQQALRFNRLLATALAEHGISVGTDHFFMCPHHPADGCACRKPRPGLLLLAAEKLSLDLGKSFFVGDAESDVEAGDAAGVTTVRLNRPNLPVVSRARFVCRDLNEVADWVLGSDFGAPIAP